MARRIPLLIGFLLAASAPVAQAQPSLQAALVLYAAASYEDALRALDAVRAADLGPADRALIEQHRMLCLMALGETAAAEAAAAALIEAQPAFTLAPREASPRVRGMFDAQRRRLVPEISRRAYTAAKRAYDAGAYDEAREGFATLGAWLASEDLLQLDPTLADLRTLTDGFADLTAAALQRQSAARDQATVQAARAALRDPQPIDAAPPPFTPLDIYTYDWRSTDVVPPSPLDQPISGWWGAMGEPAPGTRLGVLDLTIDATGHVTDVAIYQSVNRVYDAVLLESARQWRYRPATRGGRAVAYRRITGVVSGPTAGR